MGLLRNIIKRATKPFKKDIKGEAPLKGKPINSDVVELLPEQKSMYLDFLAKKEEAEDSNTIRKYNRKLDKLTESLNEYLLARGIEEKDLETTRELLLEQARTEGAGGN